MNVGDKSSFIKTDCLTIINMGMPHLTPLDRERLACFLAWSLHVKDMPQKSDLEEMLVSSMSYDSYIIQFVI